MKTWKSALLATLAAALVVACGGSAARAQDAKKSETTQTAKKGQKAQKGQKGKKAPAAAGKVSKLDTTAKTFTVTSKKNGDVSVSYDDKTTFKKAPAEKGQKPTDAKASDLKDGDRVRVVGKTENGKVTATAITIGGPRKKK